MSELTVETPLTISDNTSPQAVIRDTQRHTLNSNKIITIGNHLAFAISDDSIQVALCAHLGRRRKLLDVRKIYIPRSLESAELHHQFIVGAIDDLYHELGGRWKSVSLTVAGPETAFRSLIIPPLTGSAFNAAVSFEAKKQIPFPIAECHFDFRKVAEIKDNSASKLKIGVIAATRRIIAEQLNPFQTLNIPVDTVYLSQDVIGRLLVGLPEYEPDHHYCLVNIERTKSEIAYYRGCELEFSHIVSLGSQFLANRRDDTVFEYFTESLSNELQNSLDFYSGQYAQRFSNQVFIYGDMSYSDELINRLSARFEFSFLRFPVESLRLFDYDKEKLLPSLCVCLPAVAAATNTAVLSSLLPPALKAKRRGRRIDHWIVSAVAVLSILLSFAWLSGNHDLSDQKSKLSRLKAEIEQFRTSASFASYDSLKQQMALDQAYLTRIKPATSFLSLALKELSTLTQNEIRLFDFMIAKDQPDKNGRVAGVVRSASTPPEMILAEFVERLRRSPLFTHVTVDGYQKKPVDGLFELYFQISLVGKV